jgi:hypothetical protein
MIYKSNKTMYNPEISKINVIIIIYFLSIIFIKSLFNTNSEKSNVVDKTCTDKSWLDDAKEYKPIFSDKVI